MKNIALFITLIVLTISSTAQTWVTDLEEAKALAKESNQKIILVFQGSDWCAPCMKLDKEIWSSEEFKTHAEKNYVMLQADFPKRKANRLTKELQAKNDALAERYNSQGFFPHVVVLDKTGKILGKIGYEKTSPAAYIKKIDAY
jgi:thioredoxin-related protein